MVYRTTERGQQRRGAMRARILAAARRLFATRGYEATTMQHVVQEAGTSVGNLYFYFPNKDALLKALGEQVSEEFGRALDEAMTHVPPGPAQVAVGLYISARAVLRRRELARLAMEESSHRELRAACQAYQVARVQRFFESHPEYCGGVAPEWLTHAWLGAANRLLEQAIAGNLAGEPEELALFITRWNLQALGLPPATVEHALAALQHIPPFRFRLTEERGAPVDR